MDWKLFKGHPASASRVSRVTFSSLSFPDIICQPGRWNEVRGAIRPKGGEGTIPAVPPPRTLHGNPHQLGQDVDPPRQAGARAKPFAFGLRLREGPQRARDPAAVTGLRPSPGSSAPCCRPGLALGGEGRQTDGQSWGGALLPHSSRPAPAAKRLD